MTNLVDINLAGNHLSDLDDDTFLGLKDTLKVLNLDNNNITGLDNPESRYLFGLTALESLSIRNNNMNSMHVSSYSFPALKTLDLSHNVLEDFQSNNLMGFGSLEELRLNHNNLVLGVNQQLRYMTNLKKLYAYNNNIGPVVQKQFDDLGSLEYLDISNNQISEIKAKSFDNFKSTIQKIGLENNGITAQSQSFNGFSSMTNVCFKDNTGVDSSNSIYSNNVGFTVTTSTCCATGECLIP